MRNDTSRIRPIEKIAAIRRIVAECQHAKIGGVLVDLFSASAITTVHDALSESNRELFLSLPVRQMATVAFKLLK